MVYLRALSGDHIAVVLCPSCGTEWITKTFEATEHRVQGIVTGRASIALAADNASGAFTRPGVGVTVTVQTVAFWVGGGAVARGSYIYGRD